MEVFVVKIFVESKYSSSCSVEVFDSLKKAQKFSKEEIAAYAKACEGEVNEAYSSYFTMQSANQDVIIEIVKKEIM